MNLTKGEATTFTFYLTQSYFRNYTNDSHVNCHTYFYARGEYILSFSFKSI